MKNGFTLIEVMMLALIIGILAGIGVPALKSNETSVQFKRHLYDPTLPYDADSILTPHEKLHLEMIRNGERDCNMKSCVLNYKCKAMLNNKYDEMLLKGEIASEVTITNYTIVAITNYVDSVTPKEEYESIDFKFHRQK